MKKFNLKTLLILVLALILVFSLVACNKDTAEEAPEEDPVVDPTVIKSQQFFDDLWAASNSIGSNAISETDDIGVSADMSLKVFIKDKKEVYKEIDLGIAMQLVYDRFEAQPATETKVTNNSALKVKLYNAKTNTNWITLYYFLSNPYDLYIDYDGQNVVFSLDTGFNEDWAGYLRDALTNPVLGGDTSISDILTQITNTTGKEFNFNSLINVVLGIVGDATDFDIAKLINDNKSLLEDTLGIKGIIDSQGNVNLKAVFNSSIIKGFLKNSKCVPNADGSKAYSTDIVLSSTISSAVAGLLGDFGDIVNNIGVNLSFGVDKDSKIDGFKITADLAGLSVKDSSLNKTVYPGLELSINKLEFAPIAEATTASAKTYFDMTKTYSKDISLDMALVLDSTGVTLMPGNVNDYSKNATKDFSLDGKYILRVQGNGNVYDGDTFYLYAYFAKVSGSTEEKAIQLAYDGKKLIIKLDDTVKSANNESIVKTIADSLGKFAYDAMIGAGMSDYALALYDGEANSNSLLVAATAPATGYVYNEDAADTYTLNVNVNDLVEWASGQIGAFIASLFPAETTATAADGTIVDSYPIAMKSLKTIVADAFTAINTDNNALTVSVPAGKTLLSLMNSWFKLDGKNVTAETQTAWYPRTIAYSEIWYNAFTTIGYKEIKDAKSYQDLTKANTEAMWAIGLEYFTADEAGKATLYNKLADTENSGANAKITASYNDFCSALDPIDLLFGDRFVSFKGITNKHWYEILFAETITASVSVGLDDGAAITVKAGVGQASATLSLTVNATKEFDAEDLATIYSSFVLTDAFNIGTVYFTAA